MTRRELMAAVLLAQVPAPVTNVRLTNNVPVAVTVSGVAPFVGRTSQLTAMAVWANLSLSNVTRQARWRSLNPGVLTVDALGVARGISVGTVMVEADYP